jgi:hypothetical protein
MLISVKHVALVHGPQLLVQLLSRTVLDVCLAPGHRYLLLVRCFPVLIAFQVHGPQLLEPLLLLNASNVLQDLGLMLRALQSAVQIALLELGHLCLEPLRVILVLIVISELGPP